MADPADDMSGDARSANERQAAKSARRAALGEDNAPSASEIGKAVAEALARTAGQPQAVRELGPIVRASVRAGYEDKRVDKGDGSIRIATVPKQVKFEADETSDGKEYTLEHGKPIRLKREAFIRRRDQGVVILAE